MSYVSIHTHSSYSTLDGLARIEDLVARAKEFGIPALAITDHRNTSAHLKFYRACKEAGIKPILGCEINETEDRTIHSRKERQEKGFDDYHLVLLARNREGLKNLYEIVSDASTIGYFDKTEQTDLTVLAERGRGIVATSACLAGRIPRLILAGKLDEARRWVGIFREVFDEFYLEVQPNSTPEQAAVNRVLVELSRSTGAPLVLGVDAHYLTPADAWAHDVLLCIQTGKKLSDENRLRFAGGPEYYLWSPQEVEAWVTRTGIPREAVDNTLRIAEMCEVELDLGTPKLPTFRPPGSLTPEEYLSSLCWQELDRRFGDRAEYETYAARLRTELDVIIPKGFASYFLILKDILDYCRRQGIPRGGGRGSAAGSLVAYLLGITTVDPIPNGLLFERFLNPDRVTLPDIDVDLCHERRDEVIAYVRNTYTHVAQIATYVTLHPKSAVRDICRVLGLSYQLADELSSLVPDKMPDQSEVTLAKFFLPLEDEEQARARWGKEEAERLKDKATKFREKAGEHKDLLPALEKLEGVVRAVGVHAGGVLITPTEITDYCSLVASPSRAVCALDMDDVDAYGLLKLDLLGLKTVTAVYNTAAKVGVDIDNIPLDDPAVYRLYCEGRTHGIFQVSGGGITRFTREVEPRKFSDLVDILALYRPGPLDAVTETGRTIAEQYIHNRRNPDQVTYPHPDLEEILRSTYGVMIYQEQLMQISRKLAGFTMGESDELRKLVAKKKIDKLPSMRRKFVSGGVANGYPEELMNQLFDQMEKFGGYAFNRSHSAAYAWLSYQTAYLKAHYPVEYMCELLTVEAASPEKTKENIDECRRMGIPILPVDVNRSGVGFQVEVLPDGTKAIRYGLTGIKEIGEAVAEEVVKHQPYESLRDFVKRVEGRRVHKKVMRILIMAGLFDCFEPNRYRLLNEYLYDIRRFKPEKEPCKSPEAWNEVERYLADLEHYGFAVSGHPADGLPCHHWAEQPLDEPFLLSGLVAAVREYNDRRGRRMARVLVDTPFGLCEVYFFAGLWRRHGERMKEISRSSGAGKPEVVSLEVKKRRFITNELIEAVRVYEPAEAVEVEKEMNRRWLVLPPPRPASLLMKLYA